MPPRARLVHAMPGRARLRIEGARGDAPALEAITRRLGASPLVRAAEASTTTGGVLVRHDGALEGVLRFAEENGLFVTTHHDTWSDPTLRTIRDRVEALDARLIEATHGDLGLAAFTFYGLLGAGVVQVARGRVFPAGIAMMMQAMNVAANAMEGPRQRKLPPV